MKALSRVLIAKIFLTIIIWCVPLLFFPAPLLKWLGFPVPEPLIFLRLLGMAYTALVVAYCFGLRDARRNRYPHAVVWVGVVSNGGAFVLLLIAAVSSVWTQWGGIAHWIMWGSLAGTGAIASCLVLFGLLSRHKPMHPD